MNVTLLPHPHWHRISQPRRLAPQRLQSTVLVIVVVIVVIVPLGGSLSPEHFDLFACTSEIDAFVPILSGETRKRYRYTEIQILSASQQHCVLIDALQQRQLCC